MISLGTMIKRISALAGTKDVSPWETEFIRSIERRTQEGKVTDSLTEKQIDIISRIHSAHFGDHH